MGYQIKQSTTAYELLFLMIDSSDHVTGKTGLSPTVTIRKASGSFASPSGAVTEIANGWYKVAGNATDSNTLGPLLLNATGTGADPCSDRYEVVAYDPQDAVRLGLTALPNVASGSAGGVLVQGTGTTGLNVASGKAPATIAAGDLATDSVTAASVKADAVTKIQNGLSTYAGADTSGTTTLLSRLTSDRAGYLDTLNGIVAAIWANGTRTLSAFGFTVDTTANSTETAIKAKTDLIPPAPAATGDIPSASTIATAVWNVATSGLTTAGSIGKRIVDLFAGITSMASWLGALAGKTADSGTLAEIQETTAGAGYDNTTDSLQAIKDAGTTVSVSVTVPAAVAQASQNAGQITCIRGDTLSVQLPLLGTITGYSRLVLTVKTVELLNNPANTDSLSTLQIVAGTGLTILNGESTGLTASDASLTVNDASTGEVVLVLKPAITRYLEIQDLQWDCQATISGVISTPTGGVFSVVADVTQAVT